MTTALVWFRNDLRLSNHPALAEAVRSADKIIPIFILDDTAGRVLGGAQRWWLHHSLCALKKAFERIQVCLVLRRGVAQTILEEYIKRYKVDALYWNRVYEPDVLKRDEILIKTLELQVRIKTFNATLLTNPERINNKAGGYFKVYTPYWRSVRPKIKTESYATPRSFQQPHALKSELVDEWGLLPREPDWSGGFQQWEPGEAGAQKQLRRFIEDGLRDYDVHRDRPDLLGTSRLSPHLHFGEISVGEVWDCIQQIQVAEPRLQRGTDVFLKQLVWREFSYYLLFHCSSLPKKNFRENFDRFRWKTNKKHLTAWKKGLTGYPIVDAGMRELWATGYMHNRVRMIVASFLTKDLLIDWRVGEAWFWDTLLDADLANNVGGWQWVAGCGADAAPYFRIFNPYLQGKKFDPNGDYVARWVPELAALPKKYIHQPELASSEILEQANVCLGENYPKPIVDHKVARGEAMTRYRALK